MTLFDIIRNLQAIAAQEPSVRSVSDGDIYDCLNAAVDIKYGVFHITQDTHSTNGDLDVWGLNLFYIDRLLDNNENRLSIQSAGITILENVLKRFADTFGAEYLNNIVYTPFTQRFKDNCAGVFCKISISTVMDNLCEEGGKIVLVKNQDKSIDITSNGRYNVTPDYGFSGLGMVDINVDVQGGGCVASEETKTYTANGTYTITPTSGDCISKATVTVNVPSEEPVLQQKSIDIAENGSYSLAPDAGIDGLNRVDITVNVPPVPITPNLQSKSIEITENGNTIISPAEGYDGLSQVEVITNVLTALQSKSINITENGSYDVNPDMDAGFVGLASVGINVNVPSKEPVLQEKSINITENGSYSLEPDAGIDGLSRADITVNVPIPSVYVVPNGMAFRGSSFNTFPTDGLDFSQRTSLYSAWEDCSLLTEFPMIDTSNCTDFMSAWYGCYSLKSFPALDFSKGETFDFAWYGCRALTEFPALDLHNGSSIRDAWMGCSSLTTLGGFGAISADIDLSASNLLTADSMMNVINQAADLNSLGITGKTMTFGSANLAKLTDAQKAVATNKGWTLA